MASRYTGTTDYHTGDQLKFIDSSGKKFYVDKKDQQAIRDAISNGMQPTNTIEWDAANKALGGQMESLFPKANIGRPQSEIEAEKQMAELEAKVPIFDYTNEQGLLKPEYQTQLDLSGAQTAYSKASGAQDELMGMARDTALTPYAKALMDRQALEEGKQRSDLAAQTNTAYSQGLNRLGTSGGYDSGARERMALATSRAGMTGGQDIGRESAYSRLGITSEDLGRKFDILKGAPTAYSNLSTQSANLAGQQTQNQQYNIDKAIQQRRAMEEAKTGRFSLGKQIQAAQEEANAVRRG